MNDYWNQIATMNQTPASDIFEALHQDFLGDLLRSLCVYMKESPQNLLLLRSIYHRNHDNLDAVRQIVAYVFHFALPEQDLVWLDRCIRAYFHKMPRRIPPDAATRHSLWRKQHGQCAICGNAIEESSFHMDHIIPWDYVGDELPDNYQALCGTCNLHKSNHVTNHFMNLLMYQKGVSA